MKSDRLARDLFTLFFSVSVAFRCVVCVCFLQNELFDVFSCAFVWRVRYVHSMRSLLLRRQLLLSSHEIDEMFCEQFTFLTRRSTWRHIKLFIARLARRIACTVCATNGRARSVLLAIGSAVRFSRQRQIMIDGQFGDRFPLLFGSFCSSRLCVCVRWFLTQKRNTIRRPYGVRRRGYCLPLMRSPEIKSLVFMQTLSLIFPVFVVAIFRIARPVK